MKNNANAQLSLTARPPVALAGVLDYHKLAGAMLQCDQVPCPVKHHFGPGVYIREMSFPKGAFVLGQHHLQPHFNIMLKGRGRFIRAGRVVELSAPQIFVGPAGQKACYALEDITWLNVYAAEERDVPALEARLFAPSPELAAAAAARRDAEWLAREPDRADYAALLAEWGVEAETVAALSAQTDDLQELPEGEWGLARAASAIHGQGMFATRDFAPGDFIGPARLDRRRTPLGRWVNHAAKPNAKMLPDDDGNLWLVAFQPLAGNRGGLFGDEITVDYRLARLSALQADAKGLELCQQQ